MDEAVTYCIEHHILEEFLRKNRQEVLGMLLEEFDVKKYERSLREEGIEEGIKLGLEKGRTQQQESTIRNMLKHGLSDEEICSLVECSQEALDEIIQKQK